VARPVSRIRVSAGRWKGRPLEIPRRARPTSGVAREALFDVLQESVPGAEILDLYAGSGAVGIEALSRGAVRAVFVERDREALERNLERLGVSVSEAEVLGVEAERAIASLADRGASFDLVFADPPYADPPGNGLLEGAAGLLRPGGLLVLQTDARALREEPEGLSLVRRKSYGRNVLNFYARSSSSWGREIP
jgi:16S rRNA (guanine(966)-N(2))-methyltransferase RsmD